MPLDVILIEYFKDSIRDKGLDTENNAAWILTKPAFNFEEVK